MLSKVPPFIKTEVELYLLSHLAAVDISTSSQFEPSLWWDARARAQDRTYEVIQGVGLAPTNKSDSETLSMPGIWALGWAAGLCSEMAPVGLF